MPRYIDADKLIAEYDRAHIGAPGGARKLMVDAPTADVVEVVICKDCRHCKFNSSAEVYKCDRRGYFTETVAEDDFCSYGERKETHDNI